MNTAKEDKMNTSNIESKLSVTQLHKLKSDAGRIADEKWHKTIENSNDPMAILYRELTEPGPVTTTAEWIDDNPELATELRGFLQSEHARLIADIRNELMLKYWGHLNYADKA